MLMIVDSHVHVSENWWEPIETLLFQMDKNKVDKTVLVQFAGNTDNDYEFAAVRKYPKRFLAVVNVDVNKPEAPQTLKKLAEKGAVGMRMMVNDRSPGKDPLAIWRKAAELGLSVSVKGTIPNFTGDDFKRIVKEFPELKITLEHFGGVGATYRDPHPKEDLFKNILTLAKYPNIYLKLPGLAEIMPRPFPFSASAFNTQPAIVKKIYEAFGSHKIMWASDFPNCMGREGYANALKWPIEKISFFTKEDKEWIFGKTVLSFYAR
jgi:L-fuconolactonase